MKFNPEVTTGHVLQAITVAASAVFLFVGLDRRIIYIESLAMMNKEQLTKHEETLSRIVKVEAEIQVTQMRITTLLEERTKRP